MLWPLETKTILWCWNHFRCMIIRFFIKTDSKKILGFKENFQNVLSRRRSLKRTSKRTVRSWVRLSELLSVQSMLILSRTRSSEHELVSRHFSEIKAIWLAFDSLNYFTTLIEKFYLKWVRGLVIFREGINTLNIRSTLREPFNFI